MKGLIAGLALLVVLGIGFLLYSSPTASPEMTEAEIAQIEAEVLAVMQDFIDGFNELDMAKVNETMHPEHMTFSYVGDLLDKAGYREFLDNWVQTKESWQGHLHETDVRVLSPDVAVSTGLLTIDEIHYTDGRARHYPKNAWTMLFEKTPVGWKWSMGGHTSSGFEDIAEG